MKVSEVIKKLNDRCSKVEAIINRESQTVSANAESHELRIDNLRLYAEEMGYLIKSIGYIENTPIHIVPKSILKKKSAQADFASVEEDGYYFQLIRLSTYPFGEAYLLYVAPLSEL